MQSKFKLFMGVAALGLIMGTSAMAETVVTKKTSTVNPDGSVDYQSHTVVSKNGTPAVAVVPVTSPVVTFYYYEPKTKRIASASDLSDDIISLWDTNSNKVIDNHEFYNNAMVAYEPIEYSKRTYQDIDADGVPELTMEEYTQRLQKVPTYATLNTDKKEGLTLYEFTGVGFQDADTDNDNQVSYDELKKSFYAKEGLGPKPEKINQ